MSVPVGDVDFGEQNIIYVTMDKDNKNIVEWTDPSVEELLRLLKKNLILFENGKFKTKKQLYEHISTTLKAKKFNYTGPQIENKWKSLKRSYLNRYERGFDGSSRRLSHAKGTFESEVEEILQIERPDFKKEFEVFKSVSLNVPPGFASKRTRNRKRKVISSEEEEEDEEEIEEEIQEEQYTKPDEDLVQFVLKQESPSQSPKNDMVYTDVQYVEDNHNNSDVLVRELRDIKNVIQRNIDTNTELLKNHNATHEQVLFFLDSFEKREEEVLEIKKSKLDKQEELIQQLKIQNSLIAKLVQKLGNGNNK